MYEYHRMYTLSKSTNCLSFVYNRNQNFVIGFESNHHARHVQYNINPINHNIRLQLCQKINVQDYIHIGKRVYLDTNAVLKLDKKNAKQRTYQKELAEQLSYMFTLQKVNTDEFLAQPFISDQNIVLPKYVLDESINYISFNCIAIYTDLESREEINKKLEKYFD